MENFDRENIDELLEIRQIRQYFSSQKFAPYGMSHVVTTSHAVMHDFNKIYCKSVSSFG